MGDINPSQEAITNTLLFSGSAIMAFFYQSLAFLGINTAQVITLLAIFTFSAIVGFFKTLTFSDSLRVYMLGDLLAKTLLLGVPFIFALGAKQISALYYFVDYSFSFLILGEILTIVINIQAIRTRKKIEEVDIYNVFVEKMKRFTSKIIESNVYIKEDKHSKKD
ncbi:hypothetical protein [Campylobacter insulaenigrae]|uniref:Uncharacterized protein n=1 Tax=Campylobacter insulaenigrae NCTC 12927 TaxID=1031564 RepID=A0A0A8H284_9BACT|nr:hypothetical protein [Campylobacter insulaenigrae]AJC87790.1 hypothetical protein CINS_0826 [Campylobacter insulaenigrae NCTC 12927]MCR6572982.1 hypothetical protein [Campylobacter insulaenigrae]MCR6577448.1 hypothetical protein [Campylobacter insulaenigrae]MCR6586536.1 hypothetical protein [Campylobacter insulaenigrae]VEH94126.1 Uncharacterised protein [Campylobacter insulaenigrae]